MDIKKGDIVLRLSYGKDVFFRVESIDVKTQTANLKGIDVRLCADAPISDLTKPGIAELANYRARSLRLRVELVNRALRCSRTVRNSGKKKSSPDYVNIPGRILHLDGDLEYMTACRKAYEELALVNNCFHIQEQEQPKHVEALLREYKPDILVVTGHDGMVKDSRTRDGADNYHNSRHFISSVVRARAYQPSKDDLVIFAGACQSWYQGLINAGANFASSPERVLIHCLDPVLIVEKVAYTPITKTVSIYDTLQQSVTGLKGVGGIETRGQFRLGLPNLPKTP